MKSIKRICAAVLIVLLVLSLLPFAALADDVMPQDEMQELLNSVILHPQPTGYPDVDALLAQLLAPYKKADTYTKVKAMYDWCILNIAFDWEPYSFPHTAPAYDRFAVDHELQSDPAVNNLPIPYETVNRSYHCLTEKKGICYDYSSLFAIMMRYIGIDAYVHTGIFTFEPGYGTWGHHGWTELDLNGTLYIFDPQRDYRLSANGTAEIGYYYFGLLNTWRYQPETAINEERDAQFISVQAMPISANGHFCRLLIRLSFDEVA